jgi:hypothetical protein
VATELRIERQGAGIEEVIKESWFPTEAGNTASFEVYKTRQQVYKALRRKGASKSKAAQISNAGRTRAQRSVMARKAARTRQARGRKRH